MGGIRNMRAPALAPARARTAAMAVRCTLVGAALAILMGAGPAPASHQATSSKAARADATRAIPYQQLDAATREKVAGVVAHTSLFRRMPLHVAECDPDLYHFLAENPDLIVSMWDALGISQVTVKRTGPTTFEANDGAGTRAEIELCASTADTQLYYCRGRYEGTMFDRAIEARCVLVLKSRIKPDAHGRPIATTRLDVFIEIPHAGLQIVAKTLQPLIVHSADYNFTETASFVSLVSRTAVRNPGGLARLSRRMTGVDDERREEFVELTAQVAERARDRAEQLAAKTTEAASTVVRSQDGPSGPKPSKPAGSTIRR